MLSLVVATMAALQGCARRDVPQAPRRNNLLLVTLDTTAADRLSCYGYATETTPHFDALGHEGTRFDLAIAQAAVTPVSHASILTGLNPYRHGLRVLYAADAYKLPESVPTLATILRDSGWHTGAFLSSFTVSEWFGLERGFEVFDNGLTKAADAQLHEADDGFWGWDMVSAQRRSDRTAERAAVWLGQAAEPFFGWVHFWDPHDTMVLPPAELAARFAPRGPTPEDRLSAVYDAEVSFVDRQFGRLVAALKAADRYERTIIVVVADHGEGLTDGQTDHGWWRHRLLYQEQIRVPLIVRLPRGPAAKVCPELVRTIDIFPTVLEALGVSVPTAVDGLTLRGLMAGQPEPPRRAYADQLNLYDLTAQMIEARPQDDLLYCLMDRTWKLIYKPRRPEQSELYNLRDDPRELRNLYSSAPPEGESLLNELRRLDCFVDQGPGSGLADEWALEALRSLGYLDGKPPVAGPQWPSPPGQGPTPEE